MMNLWFGAKFGGLLEVFGEDLGVAGDPVSLAIYWWLMMPRPSHWMLGYLILVKCSKNWREKLVEVV